MREFPAGSALAEGLLYCAGSAPPFSGDSMSVRHRLLAYPLGIVLAARGGSFSYVGQSANAGGTTADSGGSGDPTIPA